MYFGKSCRPRQELSKRYLVFTCKIWLRYSRERALQSLLALRVQIAQVRFAPLIVEAIHSVGGPSPQSPLVSTTDRCPLRRSDRMVLAAGLGTCGKVGRLRFRFDRRRCRIATGLLASGVQAFPRWRDLPLLRGEAMERCRVRDSSVILRGAEAL